MTVNLTYNDDLSRVQIALSAIPEGTVTVERSVNQLYWQAVRGGAAVAIGTAGTAGLDDYEFSADVPNFYRVTQTNLEANVDVFTSSGTWTKPAGLVAARITVVAGGGAGGGTAATGATTGAAGAGGMGGAAAFSEIPAASLGATEEVVVGAGGVGASGTTGGDGGLSRFGSSGSPHVSATGGIGGGTASGTGAAATLASTTAQTMVGQVQVPGGFGANGMRLASGALSMGGIGGKSLIGSGGRGGGTSSTTSPGSTGRNYGGGGGGNAAVSSQSATTGANGAGGIVIIEHIFAG